MTIITDNEAERWASGESLRVCGICESQTYYEHCPECVDDEGAPLELYEGHLTNQVATLRAQGKYDEVEDVFKSLDRTLKPIDEDAVLWAPDVALKKAGERREREIRAMIASAEEHAGG